MEVLIGQSMENMNGISGICWWFGTFVVFPYVGNVIIPTDKLHHFSEG